MVARYVELHPQRVVLVRQENAGKGEALNNGIRSSHGDIIVNVDADSFVERTAIANLARRLGDPTVDAVVGQVVVGNRRTWVGLMQWLEYRFGFHLRRTQSVLNTIHILSGAMCAYRRSAYDQTPGFRDYSRTEDMDFSLMLRGLGGRLVYADDAVCVTEGASDLRGLHNQRVRWRYGAFSCLWRHRRLFFRRRRAVASLAFYELPVAMIGYLQVLLYPIILVLALGLPIATGDYTSLALILMALPLNFAIVFAADRSPWTQLRYLPAVAILMNVAMVVEHVAMIAAIHRHLTRRGLAWTNWSRQGVGSEV
jgi:cellulose synthase/poly-beta-1,6-N-acetylglucosamine synthase-like glycosyltransferase